MLKKFFYVGLFLFSFALSFGLSYYFTFSFLDDWYDLPHFSVKEKKFIENVRQYEINEGNFAAFNWVGYKIKKNKMGYVVYMFPGDADHMSWKMFLFALSNKLCCGQKSYQLDYSGQFISNTLEKIKTNQTDSTLLIDSRDGQKYHTIKIGNNIWMAENLNYKEPFLYKNLELNVFGKKIWQYKQERQNFCMDYKESNCKKYGRLYDISSATNSCPSGWRLPTFEEWETLKLLKDYSLFVKVYAGMAFEDFMGDYKFSSKDETSFWWIQSDLDNSGNYYKNNVFKYDLDRPENKIYSNSHSDGLHSVRCVKNIIAPLPCPLSEMKKCD